MGNNICVLLILTRQDVERVPVAGLRVVTLYRVGGSGFQQASLANKYHTALLFGAILSDSILQNSPC